MAKKTKFWYVVVFTSEGAKYVTHIDNRTKTAEWNVEDKPLQMSEEMARDLTIGLLMNLYNAMQVCSPIELDTQPYRYALGHFEWVSNNENVSRETSKEGE